MSPIGVFDSGIGGLAVLRRVHERLPDADTTYLADQAFAPYGGRAPSEILRRSTLITDHLAALGCRLIVVACNTATAAAVDSLRQIRPGLEFVGMEPALKPAAQISTTNVIGVLATEGTLSADRYRTLAARHAAHVEVVHRVGQGLAMDVEMGIEGSPATTKRLASHAHAFTDAGADVVVLGCTHYSLLADRLSSLGDFRVIDPADAVARRVEDLAGRCQGSGQHVYLTTGEGGRMGELTGAPVEKVEL